MLFFRWWRADPSAGRPSGECHVARNDTHHHCDHLPARRVQRPFWRLRLGHSGMGLGGVILAVLLVLLLLGKL
jgi:hypothetical protein